MKNKNKENSTGGKQTFMDEEAEENTVELANHPYLGKQIDLNC